MRAMEQVRPFYEGQHHHVIYRKLVDGAV